MPAVVPVRFRYNSKTYWYSYSDCEPKVNDYVVVARDSGKVFGWVVDDPFEITPEQERELKAPLKEIARVATAEDLELKEELDRKGHEAKAVFRECAEKRGLDIKPVDVEYYLSGDKAIFHFSSEERIDFRDLVRDLANRLHVHVDMKQIGVRDEARAIGGFGHCGEVLCCVRMSSAFKPVSISMAKEQDLPLNPGKVSGACGRLMCCLRYEFETYKDFKSRAPKMNATVHTPAGDAKVVELNAPKELVRLKMIEGEERFFVPLSGMEKDPENEQGRPCIVCEQAFAENCPASLMRDRQLTIPDVELLDAEVPEKPKKRRKKSGKKKAAEDKAAPEQKRPEAHEKGAEAAGEGKQEAGSSRSGSRRRRSRSKSGGQGQQPEGAQQQRKQRPGQNSSNIRNPQGQAKGQAPAADGGEAAPKKASGGQRRRRGGSRHGGQSQQKEQAQQQASGAHRRPRRTSGGPRSGEGSGNASGE